MRLCDPTRFALSKNHVFLKLFTSPGVSAVPHAPRNGCRLGLEVGSWGEKTTSPSLGEKMVY